MRLQWRILLLASSAVFGSILLYGRGQRGLPVFSVRESVLRQQQPANSSCDRVFSLSDHRPFWDVVPGRDRCRASGLTSGQTRQCLTLLHQTRRRAAHVVFVGDSRLRGLYERLVDDFQLRPEGIPVSDAFPHLPNARSLYLGSSPFCTEAFEIYSEATGQVKKVACSLAASSQLLRAEFFWRTHVDDNFTRTLDELTLACRSAACPDLVVVQTGMWYAKPFSREHSLPLQERVLRMRLDAVRLAEHLRRLAQHVKLVYRLNGPEMTESQGSKSRVGGVLLAINGLAFDVLRRAGRTQLWTSNVSDTLHFYHSVCVLLARAGQLQPHPVRHECLDENHVGATVRGQACDMLLSYLCRHVHGGRPEHCCQQHAVPAT